MDVLRFQPVFRPFLKPEKLRGISTNEFPTRYLQVEYVFKRSEAEGLRAGRGSPAAARGFEETAQALFNGRLPPFWRLVCVPRPPIVAQAPDVSAKPDIRGCRETPGRQLAAARGCARGQLRECAAALGGESSPSEPSSHWPPFAVTRGTNVGEAPRSARRESRVPSFVFKPFGQMPVNEDPTDRYRRLPPYLSTASIGGEAAGMRGTSELAFRLADGLGPVEDVENIPISDWESQLPFGLLTDWDQPTTERPPAGACLNRLSAC